jgi:hypothetical protein
MWLHRSVCRFPLQHPRVEPMQLSQVFSRNIVGSNTVTQHGSFSFARAAACAPSTRSINSNGGSINFTAAAGNKRRVSQALDGLDGLAAKDSEVKSFAHAANIYTYKRWLLVGAAV